jgi:hypothetical protein
MKNSICIFISVVCAISTISSFGSDKCQIVGQLVNEIERKEKIHELYALRENAIPKLIEEIGSLQKQPFILSAPKNSNIEGPLNCYCGVVAAYMIETILAKENLVLENPSPGFFLGTQDEDYVYRQGIITRNNGYRLESSDLRRIQRLYLRWWQKNKEMSLEEMRNSWQIGLRPLSNSTYRWK